MFPQLVCHPRTKGRPPGPQYQELPGKGQSTVQSLSPVSVCLLNTCGRTWSRPDCFLCFPTLGATQVPSLLFWSFNGLLLVVDTTGKPNFISRYRIQVGKNEPVDPVKLRQSIRTVLFNQHFITCPVLVVLYPILRLWGDPCRRELPTFHWFLLELAFFTLTEEVMFYYSHRWAAPRSPRAHFLCFNLISLFILW